MSRKYVLSGLSVVLSLALCVLYIFASVLKTPLLEDAPTITVSMNRTGGLFEGSLATYRGVRIGKVTKIDLTPDGVRATVRLSGDEKIPRDSEIKVRSLSPVGEQYLDFRPRSADGPYLEDGDDVPASATDLPQTLGGMAITLNELIEQVDPDKVETVLDELSTGLQGTEGDLRTLVEDGSDLLQTLDENWPVTERLLGNGRTLLRIGVEHSADISRLARSSKLFAAWLRATDPTLFRLLSRAPGQVDELRRLVKDVSQTLPQLLDPSVTLTDVLAARDPHVRELLIQFPRGFATLAGAIRNGTAHLDAILQRTKTCDYPTSERGPRETSHRALQDGGHCSRSGPYSQRGAQWAPSPLR